MPARCLPRASPGGQRKPVAIDIVSAVKRFAGSIVLSVLVPGSGLVALGRPWLGLLLALGFLLAMETGLVGLLIAPAVVPAAIAWVGLAAGGLIWIVAQVLQIARIRVLTSTELPRELAILRRLARRAMDRGDHAGARAALAIAMSLDDSDPETHIQRARLLDATASPARARRAWLAAERFDSDGRHSPEIRPHLDAPDERENRA